ncbi:MAG: AAA family ATPase [Deltaproteobacteria bacterium]|nr:AAA family ATPase [Deltaproteobacteria bacterium]
MIKSIRVKNFKNFREAKFEVRPLNIFIGPNGTGKSNLGNFLLMLSFLASGPFSSAFGPGPFTFRQTLSRKARDLGDSQDLDLHFEITLEVEETNYSYCLVFTEIRRNEYLIKEETLQEIQGEILFTINDIKARESKMAQMRKGHAWNDSEKRIRSVAQYLSKIKRYRFVPDLIKKPAQIQDSFLLDHTGENLAAVIHFIEKNYPENFYKIVQEVKRAIPGTKRIFTPHLGDPGQVGIGVEEENKTGYFVGPQLSDGFLVFLALCTLFNLPDQPRIFFIEEPETYLNPNRLRVLYGLMHRYAANNPNKQILMSSHSPYFLDWSDKAPEELTLMLDRDGWVEFRNLQGINDLRYFLEEDSWGRDWVTKFFRADFADDPLPEIQLNNFCKSENSDQDPEVEGIDQQAGESRHFGENH